MATKNLGKMLIPMMIAIFITVLLAPIALNYTNVKDYTLYAHSEGVTVGSAYKTLKIAVPDGTESNITLEEGGAGLTTMGNSSIIQCNAIETSYGAPVQFSAGTWTIRYRVVANVTNKAKMSCNITLVDSADGHINLMKNASDIISSSLVTNAWTVIETDITLASSVAVNTTRYLKVEWFVNKTDTTQLQVDLCLDRADMGTNSTGLYSVDFAVRGLSGTIYTMAITGITFIFLGVALGAIYLVLKGKK